MNPVRPSDHERILVGESLFLDCGQQKIQVIKVVRAATGLGLKEAKDLVDGAPGTVKEALAKDEAENLPELLRLMGEAFVSWSTISSARFCRVTSQVK